MSLRHLSVPPLPPSFWVWSLVIRCGNFIIRLAVLIILTVHVVLVVPASTLQLLARVIFAVLAVRVILAAYAVLAVRAVLFAQVVFAVRVVLAVLAVQTSSYSMVCAQL